MKINIGDISLLSTEASDSDLKKLNQDADLLINMSETRMYPPGTPTEIIFKIILKDEIIGEVRFKTLRWFNRKAELSIMLTKQFQGKGYGTKIMQTVMQFAFEKMNLHRLEAEVIEFNKPSIQMVEKLGFVMEGRLREAKYSEGKYWDLLRYGILREEYKKI